VVHSDQEKATCSEKRRRPRKRRPKPTAATRNIQPAPKSKPANRSKNNAFRHGLTSQVTVMTDPGRDAQQKFIKAYIADI